MSAPPPAVPPADADPDLGPLPDVQFARELQLLLQRANGRAMTLDQIEKALPESTTYGMMMLFFALPFSLPVSIPGLSTPFGIAIMALGACVAIGIHPRLPRRARQIRVEFDRLRTICGKGVWFAEKFSRLIRTGRLRALVEPKFARRGIGLAMLSSGFYLGLPLPIPLTNTIPAYSLILLAIGWMERDGRFVLFGYILAVAAWAYILALWLMGSTMISGLWSRIFG